MLSEKAQSYIKQSVPVLQKHGLEITRVFYKSLFEDHPELKNIFNMGNQANDLQAKSLAAALFAYAAHFNSPEALAPVISRIVHKHASLGIKPEHYPIVGHHLLNAIKTILKEAATPDLIAAWAEAYESLSNGLIEAERELYKQAKCEAGELRSMRVKSISVEGNEINAYVLEAIDDKPIPSFKPGQYICVAIYLPTGLRQLRQYSLSDAPGKNNLRISVKKEEAGSVSTWLHHHVKENHIIEVSMPFGDFTPDTISQKPIVLLSAGVGITPMISVLNDIANNHPDREVIFAHAARHQQVHAHREDIINALKKMKNLQVSTFYDVVENENYINDIQQGPMTIKNLPIWAYQDTDVYMCGSRGFMQNQKESLMAIGVPASKIHREVFGPELLEHLM